MRPWARLATPWGYAAGAAVVIALAVWARFALWSWTFGSGRVELIPSDSHYYVRLARLQLEAGRPVPFDPYVGFPAGSESYWPHLHALLVTVAVGLSRDAERGAAFVGPVASVLWLVAVLWAARRPLGAYGALFAGYLLALTPISVDAGKVGNADHNVHEAMLAALVTLLGTSAVLGSTGAALAAGALAGAGRLFTTTGFVFPGVLALSYPVAAMFAVPETRAAITRRAWLSGATCVGVLLASVLLLGHPNRVDYEALTLFHPLLALALFGIAIAGCALLEGQKRSAALAGSLGLAILPLAPQLLRAAGQLLRQDPLLAVVSESQPLLTRPVFALEILGPTLLAFPVAAFGAARALRSRASPELAVALVAAVLFSAGAAAQARFATFFFGATAVLLPLGLGRLLAMLGRPARVLAYVLATVVFALLWTPGGPRPTLLMLQSVPPPPEPAPAAMIRPTLVWMRENLPAASSDPLDYRAQPTYGVLAPYDYGHYITLYAERPVLASPFSQTDAHVEANRVASEILSDTDEERAFRRARELKLAYVLAAPSRLLGDAPLPADALLSRLMRRDSFGRFLPLHVSTEVRPGGGRYATVFEVVDGAVLTGSIAPGGMVEARLADGYARSAAADSTGAFRIRVSRPGDYVVSTNGLGTIVGVTEEQVRAGASVAIGARP